MIQEHAHDYAPINAGRQYHAHPTQIAQPPPPPAPAAAPAQQAKPTEKEIYPEPPLRIVDSNSGAVYKRVGFLGEGGFARVYEVQTPRGDLKAVKVVCKASIKSRKNKTKLWAEIKLHQMLLHPNVVRFEDCFEDDENVYMVLELCENGSLMDLLKRRKRYTEPEARCIMVQVIGACQYMHQTNVIHRDLKLGNLFFDREMDVKVGDLGLAALIENPGDRKKTICGTPNYIAPEVLFDTANGHSFEVDVWSVGVILYTLIIGKPPFQTKDVRAIYKRIKENRYEFPPDKPISTAAKELIMWILDPNPESRPSLDKILRHHWFLAGEFPPRLPLTSMDSKPGFSNVTCTESRRNFLAACQRAKIGVEVSAIPEPVRARTALGPSIMQQEKDFKNAVQPDSPISALLHSARQPLVQAPAQIKEASLLRKLTAAGAHATLSPARRGSAKNPGPSSRRMEVLDEGEEEVEHLAEEEPVNAYEAGVRQRELANQKARIVSQMAVPRPVERVSARSSPRKAVAITSGLSPARTVAAPAAASGPSTRRVERAEPVKQPPIVDDIYEGKMKTSLFDVVRSNLDFALKKGPDFRSNVEDGPLPPRVFVISWLDYCTKYGMGFAMTDGTISVHFNDSSSLVLAPGKKYFDNVQAPTEEYPYVRRDNHHVDSHPRELTNKVYLMRHFETYMLDRLIRQDPYIYQDVELTRGMVYITKYLRMKHVMVFRLSNEVLQFNFYDHTKLILSRDGLVVSIIDKHYVLKTWSLEELLQPPPDDAREKDVKRREAVIHKVHYARDVLGKIKDHALTLYQEQESAQAVVDAQQESKTRAHREHRERREMRPIR